MRRCTVEFTDWVLELAGFSVATGVTARWVGGQTRSAAKAARTVAERTAIMNRRREDDFDFEPAEWPAHAPRDARAANGAHSSAGARSGAAGVFDDPFANVPGQIGPVDLVGDARDDRASRLRRRFRRLDERTYVQPGLGRCRQGRHRRWPKGAG